jgi:hypothetical protein
MKIRVHLGVKKMGDQYYNPYVSVTMAKSTHNNCFQLTVKSVTFFAKQKNAPLFTSAEAGVSLQKIQSNFLVNSCKNQRNFCFSFCAYLQLSAL